MAPSTNGALKGHINHGAQLDGENQIVLNEKTNQLQLATVPKDLKTVESADEAEPIREFSWSRAFQLLWKHFKTSYADTDVVTWSLWGALATCGALQVNAAHSLK